jgi:hypothetical protein
VIDNNRYKKLKFKADLDVTMHGCLGYFSSVLYKDVNISILPATYSHGMFSWFPIFFPLRVCANTLHSEFTLTHSFFPKTNSSQVQLKLVKKLKWKCGECALIRKYGMNGMYPSRSIQRFTMQMGDLIGLDSKRSFGVWNFDLNEENK